MNLAPKVMLSASERTKLNGLLSSRGTPRALRLRTRAILLCAEGKSNLEVGHALKVTNLTVGRWRRQFLIRRLKGFEQERRGRHVLPLSISRTERTRLETWARSTPSSANLAIRARVILECAAGKSNITVAHNIGLCELTVGKLRRRFFLRRLTGLKPDKAGKRLTPLVLNADDEKILQAWALYSPSETLARRAKVILLSATGKANVAIAQEVDLSARTVGYLRRRFLEQRLTGLTYGCEYHVTEIG